MAVHYGVAAHTPFLPVGGEQQGIGQLQGLGDAPGRGGLDQLPLAQTLQTDAAALLCVYIILDASGLRHLPQGLAGLCHFVVLPGLGKGQLLVDIIQMLRPDFPQL